MEFRKRVEELVSTFLKQRNDLFLIDLKISAADDIVMILDGDHGVSIQDCLDASRAVENNLDRDAHDFSLQVMSAGATEPLVFPRQFHKSIGREIEILTQEAETVKGEIVAADEQAVTLLLRYRKPKDIGKGKVDVEEEKQFPYADIKKAVVRIKF